MKKQKAQVQKIIKEYKDASPQEVWEGVRDNFIFGFFKGFKKLRICYKRNIKTLSSSLV